MAVEVSSHRVSCYGHPVEALSSAVAVDLGSKTDGRNIEYELRGAYVF